MNKKGRHLEFSLFFMILLFAAVLFPVTAQAKKISISQKSAYMAKKDTLQLKIKNAKAKDVKWSSNNRKVAVVSQKGLVTAKRNGKATITAKVKKKKYTCKVVVEAKTVNRARRLRDYVLEKGKKDKDTGMVVLKKTAYDDNTETTNIWSVAASPKNKKLVFEYQFRSVSPYCGNKFTMTIDLISGSSSNRKGTVRYIYTDADDPSAELDYEGTIKTKRDDDDEYSVSITKVGCAEYDETEGYSLQYYKADPISFNDENETLSFRMNKSFDEWDAFFKTVKGLKKYNISMKSIGFGWR